MDTVKFVGLEKLIKEKLIGISELIIESRVSYFTLLRARKGENISFSIARKILEGLNVNPQTAFKSGLITKNSE
jgi:hypothetical protein